MRLPRPLWFTMGCGTSRFNLMEEGMACGLKRKMVESRSKNDLLDNHDNSTTSTTSTTKLLLKEGSGDLAAATDSPSHRHHLRKASSDSVVIKEPPLQPQIREKEYVERSGKGECRLNTCERGMEKEERDDETDDDEHERAEDNDFGRKISDFDGNWIGSPSFREYCVDSESDQDAVNHGRGSGKGTEKKTQGTDNLECSNEVCVLPGPKHLEKKGSRGRKFMRAFPTMHKPKNLWHVTACYTRNNHHDLSQKLPEKEV